MRRWYGLAVDWSGLPVQCQGRGARLRARWLGAHRGRRLLGPPQPWTGGESLSTPTADNPPGPSPPRPRPSEPAAFLVPASCDVAGMTSLSSPHDPRAAVAWTAT